jgi:hypothetical protein
MRTILAVSLLSACAVTDGDSPADPGTVPKPTIYDRLGDLAGPIPGLPGFSVERTADANRCGGVHVRIVKAPDAAVPAGDEELVRMFEVPPPATADFGEPHKEQAMNDFKHWFDALQEHAKAASVAYGERAKDAAPETATKGLARSVQTMRFMASAIVRTEIPVDVRTGDNVADKIGAYCDALEQAAQPLVARADATAKSCADRGASLTTGWWTTVCR